MRNFKKFLKFPKKKKNLSFLIFQCFPIRKTIKIRLRSVGVGSCGLEGAIESLLAGSWQGLDDRESDFGVLEIPRKRIVKLLKSLK